MRSTLPARMAGSPIVLPVAVRRLLSFGISSLTNLRGAVAKVSGSSMRSAEGVLGASSNSGRINGSVKAIRSQSNPSTMLKTILIGRDPHITAHRENLADVADARREFDEARPVGEVHIGLKFVEGREEAQQVAAERASMVDDHFPAIFLGDLGQKIVVALIRLLADEFLRAARIGDGRRGFDRRRADGQCRTHRIDDRHQQIFERDDRRSREIGKRELADRGNRNARTIALCCPAPVDSAHPARSP